MPGSEDETQTIPVAGAGPVPESDRRRIAQRVERAAAAGPWAPGVYAAAIDGIAGVTERRGIPPVLTNAGVDPADLATRAHYDVVRAALDAALGVGGLSPAAHGARTAWAATCVRRSELAGLLEGLGISSTSLLPGTFDATLRHIRQVGAWTLAGALAASMLLGLVAAHLVHRFGSALTVLATILAYAVVMQGAYWVATRRVGATPPTDVSFHLPGRAARAALAAACIAVGLGPGLLYLSVAIAQRH